MFFYAFQLGLTPYSYDWHWPVFSAPLFCLQVLSSHSLEWPSKPWGQLWALLLLASEHLLPRTWTWPISSAEVAFFFLIWFLSLNYWEDYCLITYLKVDPIAWPTLLGVTGSSYSVIFNVGEGSIGNMWEKSLLSQFLDDWEVPQKLLFGNGQNSLSVKWGLCRTEFWYSKLDPTPEPSHMKFPQSSCG